MRTIGLVLSVCILLCIWKYSRMVEISQCFMIQKQTRKDSALSYFPKTVKRKRKHYSNTVHWKIDSEEVYSRDSSSNIWKYMCILYTYLIRTTDLSPFFSQVHYWFQILPLFVYINLFSLGLREPSMVWGFGSWPSWCIPNSMLILKDHLSWLQNFRSLACCINKMRTRTTIRYLNNARFSSWRST